VTGPDPNRFGWLVTNFAERYWCGARRVVSAEACCSPRPRGCHGDRADQLAAVSSGMISLTQGAARCFEAGVWCRPWSRWSAASCCSCPFSDGSCLAVLASPTCDIGLIGYEMTLLVDRVGQLLTPELRRSCRAPGALAGVGERELP